MSTDADSGVATADEPTDRPRNARAARPEGGPLPRTAREVALAAEVGALEAELARRERRHRRTIERYESLLETQARAGREADAFEWTEGSSSFAAAPRSPGLLDRLRALVFPG